MSNFIAIDLDSQGLYAVAGAARGNVRVTHALAWGGEDEEPPPALTGDTAKAIGEKLRDKLRAAGVAPAPVIVSVGRDRVILKELKYPPVAPTEEPALIRFQAMKEMSESPEEVLLDYAPLGEVAGERRAMAVVMRKELFNAIQAMCLAGGFKLAGVSPRPYAAAAGLMRAFAADIAPPPGEKEDAVVALTLGPAGGELTVVRRGEVTFTLAVPAPVVASETMLIAQIRRNLAVYAGQNPGSPVRAVYLSEVGGPWAQRLGAALSVPLHAFDPLAGAVPAVAEPLRGRFAGAVGLLAGRAASTLPINFASPRQPRVEGDPLKRRLALVGGLALLVVAAGLGIGVFVADAATGDVDELARKREQLKAEVEKGAPTMNRLKAIDGWSQREVNWLDELYELARRMPDNDGVRVASLHGTPIAADRTGKQESQANLELKLAAVQTSAGTNLLSAFVRDNPAPNKFYVGTSISFGGVLTNGGSGKHNQSVTIRTKVNHREPKEYAESVRFAPLKRTTGGAGVSAVPPPEPPTTEAALAPPPAEKAADGAP